MCQAMNKLPEVIVLISMAALYRCQGTTEANQDTTSISDLENCTERISNCFGSTASPEETFSTSITTSSEYLTSPYPISTSDSPVNIDISISNGSMLVISSISSSSLIDALNGSAMTETTPTPSVAWLFSSFTSDYLLSSPTVSLVSDLTPGINESHATAGSFTSNLAGSETNEVLPSIKESAVYSTSSDFQLSSFKTDSGFESITGVNVFKSLSWNSQTSIESVDITNEYNVTISSFIESQSSHYSTETFPVENSHEIATTFISVESTPFHESVTQSFSPRFTATNEIDGLTAISSLTKIHKIDTLATSSEVSTSQIAEVISTYSEVSASQIAEVISTYSEVSASQIAEVIPTKPSDETITIVNASSLYSGMLAFSSASSSSTYSNATQGVSSLVFNNSFYNTTTNVVTNAETSQSDTFSSIDSSGKTNENINSLTPSTVAYYFSTIRSTYTDNATSRPNVASTVASNSTRESSHVYVYYSLGPSSLAPSSVIITSTKNSDVSEFTSVMTVTSKLDIDSSYSPMVAPESTYITSMTTLSTVVTTDPPTSSNESASDNSQGSSDTTVSIIIGAVLGTAVVIVLIILLCMYVKRKKMRQIATRAQRYKTNSYRNWKKIKNDQKDSEKTAVDYSDSINLSDYSPSHSSEYIVNDALDVPNKSKENNLLSDRQNLKATEEENSNNFDVNRLRADVIIAGLNNNIQQKNKPRKIDVSNMENIQLNNLRISSTRLEEDKKANPLFTTEAVIKHKTNAHLQLRDPSLYSDIAQDKCAKENSPSRQTSVYTDIAPDTFTKESSQSRPNSHGTYTTINELDSDSNEYQYISLDEKAQMADKRMERPEISIYDSPFETDQRALHSNGKISGKQSSTARRSFHGKSPSSYNLYENISVSEAKQDSLPTDDKQTYSTLGQEMREKLNPYNILPILDEGGNNGSENPPLDKAAPRNSPNQADTIYSKVVKSRHFPTEVSGTEGEELKQHQGRRGVSADENKSVLPMKNESEQRRSDLNTTGENIYYILEQGGESD